MLFCNVYGVIAAFAFYSPVQNLLNTNKYTLVSHNLFDNKKEFNFSCFEKSQILPSDFKIGDFDGSTIPDFDEIKKISMTNF